MPLKKEERRDEKKLISLVDMQFANSGEPTGKEGER